EASRLDWTEPAQERHARLLSWYRDLIALRRTEPDLASGDLDRVAVAADPSGAWLVVHRGDVRVVVVLAEQDVEVDVDRSRGATVLAAWDPDVRLTDRGVQAPARSVTVLRLAADLPADAQGHA